MQRIPLSKGQHATVDDQDFDLLNQWRWYCRHGYAVRNIYLGGGRKKPRYRTVAMHRLITDAPAGLDVDHKNRDPLDNRRRNLRVCSRSQNSTNSRKRSGSSRFKGVCWLAGRKAWIAQICKDGRRYELITTKDEEEAALYYDIAAQLLHGPFAHINHV